MFGMFGQKLYIGMLSAGLFIASWKSLLFQPRVVTPTESECGHNNAGQELCYLCHQRAARNIPVSFEDEKRRRELEEDKIIHDYQIMKNNEFILGEQVCWQMARSSFIRLSAWSCSPLAGDATTPNQKIHIKHMISWAAINDGWKVMSKDFHESLFGFYLLNSVLELHPPLQLGSWECLC